MTVESNDDVDLAKTFHQTTLGTRRQSKWTSSADRQSSLLGTIDVFESNPEEMAQTLDNTNSNDQQSHASETNAENWREPVVRLRGLPYNSSKEDVTSFFNGTSTNGVRVGEERGTTEKASDQCCSSLLLGLPHLVGLDIAQNGVHISSSKPAGEAFVAFMNMDNALRALEFNRMNMGHRYGKQREPGTESERERQTPCSRKFQPIWIAVSLRQIEISRRLPPPSDVLLCQQRSSRLVTSMTVVRTATSKYSSLRTLKLVHRS